MSYCHLLEGGNGNTAFTFGGKDTSEHPCGSAPSRITNAMLAHAAEAAAAKPACFAVAAATCGNGAVNDGEVCDPADATLGGESCASKGFTSGAAAGVGRQGWRRLQQRRWWFAHLWLHPRSLPNSRCRLHA